MNPRAFIVTGLGFGDCGKGTVTDALTRRFDARLVVRFNGGAQAGHNVVLPDGRHHTFAQFGAGSFVEGVRTHLAAHVVVHPTALAVEADYLARAGVPDAFSRLTADPRCLVTTPFHQAAGRLRERLSGNGTCGVGVGETVRDALAHADDALRMGALHGAADQLERIRVRLLESLPQDVAKDSDWSMLQDPSLAQRWLDVVRALPVRLVTDEEVARAHRDHSIVFEGAQGILLDEHHGFHPHTTWSTCTARNALHWLRHSPHQVERVGVLRSTLTRHGAGPLPSESKELRLPEPHNASAGWQGAFRIGWFDPILLRYAMAANGGVDWLALTHVDRRQDRFVESYDFKLATLTAPEGSAERLAQQTALTRSLSLAVPTLAPIPDGDFADWVERALSAPVGLTSHGPTHADKRWR
ncbi:MAG: adenylosuccinate synthetase [Archangium sp.]|nr:adenylosuccinate synthetase [Archangium sp.]MDP3151095.1 adenylosuccinate synthetase [Archangium sp.]MDP3571779.1 adenylosuccinate synthetase [Archangium sp.]